MIFQYTAVSSQGARLTDTIEAASLSAAQQELLQRGLFVLNVSSLRNQTRPAARPEPRPAARAEPRPAARAEPRPAARAEPRMDTRAEARKTEGRGGDLLIVKSGGNSLTTTHESSQTKARSGELIMLSKQMSMMLQAGSPLVPALQAIAEQATRPPWAAVLADLVQRVGAGTAMNEAMAFHKRAFSGTVRSLVRAGEATGQIAQSFAQLSKLLESRHRVRQKVIASLAYPILLTLLSVSVVISMTFFILPRFAGLFSMLNSEIPLLTRLMLSTAEQLKTWWPVALGTPIGAAVVFVLWARSRPGRDTIGRLLFRLPLAGRAVASVMLTQVLQLWAAALRSKVPLIEAIQQAREVSSNIVLQEMVDSVVIAVEQGNALSTSMKRFHFVPATVLAAIHTGEQSGKLGESLDFVSQWLEEESSAMVTGLTRLIEPIILIGMGVLVGGVAIALFLPLFDLATAM